jgi:DNA-binding SARP family transcriptional activator/tetratricopeptide (TPR) repeat protein
MATGLEFGLLGPLVVRRGGVAVPVPPGKQRVVLAALLLKANRVVAVDELAGALWGEEPPGSARVSVQNYVKRLRDSLGREDPSPIVTGPGGYLIGVAAGALDVSRFEGQLGAARVAARDGSWEAAAAEAGAALALWRGEPLADVDSEVLAAREVPRLVELRLQAAEIRIEADLQRGRAGEVIGELRRLAAADPLRERLHALLMLALYREGRQGEALAAYARVRQVLIEELGTEPGTELRELHQRILTADPALDAPAPTPAGGPGPGGTGTVPGGLGSDPGEAGSELAAGSGPAQAGGPVPVVPRELPARIRHFTGRGAELKELSALLDQADAETPAVVISAIGGTAGVGKTALAVQWAYQVAGLFPDGQLYVNLRGYDPAQPMTATGALAGFLRSLGVAGPGIPAGEDERAARYRSLLAGRRLLVVLDNAGSVEQVRPLLPGSAGCVVVVTSRDALAGLVARDGARRLDLDLLPLPEAVGLLRALIGTRVDDGPEAAAALAQECARLPLALRVAAELAAARPDVPLADLAGELAGHQRRLDLLNAGGDPRTAVRAVFSWSYRHLGADAARAFRLAGLHPGTDFGLSAAAALTATTVEQAARLLDVLARAHLVQRAGPGRYGLHDLLRAYAAELAVTEDGEEAQRTALTRLFDYYLGAAAAAMDALYPDEKKRRPQPPPPAGPVPAVPAPAAARDWLDAERACLVTVTAAAAGGWPRHAIALAGILYTYLDVSGYVPDTQAVYLAVLEAGRQAGDLTAQADALRNLGLVDIWQSHYQQAAANLASALELYRQTGDRRGQARTLNSLGIGSWRQGRLRQAAGQLRQAAALHREIGDQLGESSALTNLGLAEERQGHYEEAAAHHRESLAICREIGYRQGQAVALDNLGEVLCRQGHYQPAEDHLGQALAIYHELGYRRGEADALQNLGHVRRGQARYRQATGLYRQALAIFAELGDGSGEAEALNSLGEALSGAGLPGEARGRHQGALTVACRTGDKAEEARAHDGLARAYHAAGDPGQARRHWRQALALYTELGTPEAGEVRAQLSAAGDDDHSASRKTAGH